MQRFSDAGITQKAGESSRERLLATAGEVFAEKGFDRATAREICIAAGVNPAAVNYYFTSKEGLYETVLQVAHRRILDLETLAASIPEGVPPERKLEGFLRVLVPRLFATPRDSWHLRLIAREMANPTPAFAQLVEAEIRPKSMFLRGILSELLERPIDDPAVSFCAMSVVSQMLSVFQNMAAFSAILPEFGQGETFVEAICEHIVQFSLGGVERVRSRLS